MKLINSINFAGIAESTISNLEKMFGIPSDVYLPDKYSIRTSNGSIEYKDEPIISRSILFTNYVQNVFPTPGFKAVDIRPENLECYLPADPVISSIPLKSLVVVHSVQGDEKYIISDIEALKGDAQTFIIKWTMKPATIYMGTDEELEQAQDILDTEVELYDELEIESDRVTFEEDDVPTVIPVTPEEKTEPIYKIDDMEYKE